MAEHLVCLSIDVDNTSAMLARGLDSRAMLSRGDFGAVGTARLLSLLALYGVTATWFIPGHSLVSYPASLEPLYSSSHELAVHGWSHQAPATLSLGEEENKLLKARDAMIALTGRTPLGCRAPSWEPSWHTTALLAKHGFGYDSSLMADDYTPYFVSEGDSYRLAQPVSRGRPSTLVELPCSPTLDDFSAFEPMRYASGILPGLRNTGAVLENWLADFSYMARELDWGVLTYVVHPHVIGRGHRMLFLERLIVGILEQGAVRDNGRCRSGLSGSGTTTRFGRKLMLKKQFFTSKGRWCTARRAVWVR